MEKILLCGAAKAEITPAFPMYMGGYSCRREKSHGTHDPLYVRALALECGAVKTILFSFDLLAVDGLVSASLDEISRLPAFGGAAPVFLYAATHTHHGPDGFPPNIRFGERSTDEYIVTEYRSALAESIKKAAVSAWERRAPCDMYLGYGEARFGLNRRDPAGPRCDRVTFLRFSLKREFALRSEPEKTAASILHYTCHPTSMPRLEAVFSADYPGVACGMAEESLGGSCMFFNGACGDISTRYSRKEESPAETRRFGTELASAALAAARTERKLPPELSITVGELPAGDEKYKTALLGFGGWDGLKALLIPGELFCSIANGWHERYPALDVWGYALGYAGYIPDAEAYEKGGYEVEASRLTKKQAARFFTASEEFLQDNCNKSTEEL